MWVVPIPNLPLYLDFNNKITIQVGTTNTGVQTALPIAYTTKKCCVVCSHAGSGATPIILDYRYAANLTTNLFIGQQSGWAVHSITLGF